MKTSTFIRLSLLFPYALWILSFAILSLVNAVTDSAESNGLFTFLTLVLFLFTAGIVIWCIPYTLLAIGLWIWSRGKPARQMAKVFAFAPLIMAVLVSVEMLIFSGVWGNTPSAYDFMRSTLAMIALSIGFGYPIVGLVAGMYQLFRRAKFLREDEESPPAVNTEI